LITLSNEEPYDREFNNPDSYIPYAMRMNVPDKFKGPNAIIPKVKEVIEINTPSRTVDKSLAERNVLRSKNKNNTKNNANSDPQRDNNKNNKEKTTTNLVNNNDLDDYGEKNPHNNNKVDVQNNSGNSNNNQNNDYDKNTNTEMTYDNKDLAVYWYKFHIRN
jgi:hypothetical protein